MKLYLQRIEPPEGEDLPIHGVDYHKNVPPEGCGRRHEFSTRSCRPIVFTEEEMLRDSHPERFVELTPFLLVEDE